jgi:hypothetical protein
MRKALAEGEADPAALAALADTRWRATPAQWCDALGACTEPNPVYRRLLKMASQEWQRIEEQIGHDRASKRRNRIHRRTGAAANCQRGHRKQEYPPLPRRRRIC